MLHARSDYDRIQDPDGLIPEDEPVFLIRGCDRTGAATLRHWAALNQALPDHDDHAIQLALGQAEKMDAWHTKKTSDVPPEA